MIRETVSPRTPRDRAVHLLRRDGILRARDLSRRGIDRKYLTLLVREGVLTRVSRGTYELADARFSEHQSLAEAAARVPGGVVCLLSALRFHDVGTQAPFEVWMAVHGAAWRPRVEYPPVRYMSFTGSAWSYGAEMHRIDGVPVRVYTPAKTVADCFKYRNKIGIDVAMEALRDVWERRMASMHELRGAAEACRMSNVMRPYLEMLLAS